MQRSGGGKKPSSSFHFPGDNNAIRAEVLRRLNATPSYRRLFGKVFADVVERLGDRLQRLGFNGCLTLGKDTAEEELLESTSPQTPKQQRGKLSPTPTSVHQCKSTP